MPSISRLDFPGLNFLSKLLANDFEFSENVSISELINRFQAIFGANFTSLNSYGVIEDIDPAQVSSQALTPALMTESDPFTYGVTPGSAVTPKGQLIIITTMQTVTIPANDGRTYYIVASYNVIDSDRRLLRLNKYVPAKRVLDEESNLISVIDEQSYRILTQSEISNKVIIGVVKVALDTTTQALTTFLDLTRTTVADNRPWWSPVDYFHRSQVGNPHKTQLEDLDQGSVPLMQKFRQDGFIIAQDLQYPFFPGHLCVQDIKRSQVSPSSYSFTLPRRPVRLGRLYLKSDTTKEFAYTYDPIENVIYFLVAPPTPTIIDNADMWLDTLVVDSLEPALLSNTVRVADLSTIGEAVISQGKPVRTLTSNDVPTTNFGPGKVQRGKIFVAADGSLIRSPTTLLCQARLNIDIIPGESLTTPSIPLPGVLRVIVRDQVDVSGEITIVGTDIYGNSLQEVVTFAFDHNLPDGWILSSPAPVTLMEDVSQFGKLTAGDTGVSLVPEMKRITRLITTSQCPCRYTANVFASVSSVRLDNLTGGSTSGTITVQALLDTRSLLQIAEVIVREGVVTTMVDNRPILSGLETANRGVDAALQSADVRITSNLDVYSYVENFTNPKFADFRMTNLEDPANSPLDVLASPIRPANTMIYVSKLLPIHLSNQSAPTVVSLMLEIFSMVDHYNTIYGSIQYISLASGTEVVVGLTTINNNRIVEVNAHNFAPNSVNAVRVTLQGAQMNGFALRVPGLHT